MTKTPRALHVEVPDNVCLSCGSHACWAGQDCCPEAVSGIVFDWGCDPRAESVAADDIPHHRVEDVLNTSSKCHSKMHGREPRINCHN
jgi:hypothetical protein